MDNLNYIYLLQEREFVKCNENIYKVGKTKKDQFTRFNQYPNGSILLLQIKCNDCDCNEREIIKLFKSKYTYKKQIGHEYFEGDYEDMMKNIFNIVLKNNGKKGSYCVDDAVNDVVDDVVDDIVVKVAKPVAVKVAKPKAIKSKNPTASIKHPRTAFSFFTQQQRPICQKAHPEATFGQLSRFVSEGWKALTPKQMNIYKSLETDDKARYQAECDVVLAKVAADNKKTVVSKVITPKAIKSSKIIYNKQKSKTELEKYLYEFTIKILQKICRYFMISIYGNKDKIIENIIKLKHKNNMLDYMLDEIINSNKYERKIKA